MNTSVEIAVVNLKKLSIRRPVPPPVIPAGVPRWKSAIPPSRLEQATPLARKHHPGAQPAGLNAQGCASR